MSSAADKRKADIAALRAFLDGEDEAIEASIEDEPQALKAPPRYSSAAGPVSPFDARYKNQQEWTCCDCGVTCIGTRVIPLRKLSICGGCFDGTIEAACDSLGLLQEALKASPALLALVPSLEGFFIPPALELLLAKKKNAETVD